MKKQEVENKKKKKNLNRPCYKLNIKKRNKSLKSNIKKDYEVESCLVCFEEFASEDLIISASHDGIYHPSFYHAKCIVKYMNNFKDARIKPHCMLCRSDYNVTIPELFNPTKKDKDSVTNIADNLNTFRENIIIVFHNNNEITNNYFIIKASFFTVVTCRFYNYPGSTFMGFYVLGLLIGCLFSSAGALDRQDNRRLLILYLIRMLLYVTRIYLLVDFMFYNSEYIYDQINAINSNINLRQ